MRRLFCLLSVLVPFWVLLSPLEALTQTIFDGCDEDAVTEFTVVGGTLGELSSCRLELAPPFSDRWASAEWIGDLPELFTLEVALSRPGTNKYCDQMGFILGGPTVGQGLAESGLRFMAMSSFAGAYCDKYPYAVGGRLEVARATDGLTQLIVDEGNWDLNEPLQIRVDVLPYEVHVYADSVYLGTISESLDGNKLTLLAYDGDESSVFGNFVITSTALGVPKGSGGRALLHVAPNPFEMQTSIYYELRSDSMVDCQVFDIQGQLVRTLGRGEARPSGEGVYSWDGRDESGAPRTGIFFIRLSVDGEEYESTKVIRLP